MRPMEKIGLFILPLVFVACAGTTPAPRELVTARADYERAAKGDGKQAPADLHDAKVALDRAEQSYRDKLDYTPDLAYVADRKALRAESLGRTAAAKQQIAAAQQERQGIMAKLVEKSESQAKQAQIEAQKASEQASSAQSQYESERRSREEAEKRAMDALSKTQKVKTDERGTVITLSGSVLFAFGKSDILPSAKKRLDDVAEALKRAPDRTFVVEGHTDSIGSIDANQVLSEKRANAVRDYLISRGLDESRIQAVGKGKDNPIDSNATAEGRAVNRRVEIIVQRPKDMESGGMGGGPQSPSPSDWSTPKQPESKSKSDMKSDLQKSQSDSQSKSQSSESKSSSEVHTTPPPKK